MTDYHRPAHLLDALAILSRGDARILAGGTDLYPDAGAVLAGEVVDVSGLAELLGIAEEAGGVRIGAAVTWATLAEALLPPALAALQVAARQVGGRQIQRMGTIGGNLCNASPAADGIPPLLVLDAEVEIAGPAGVRHMPLSRFLKGPRRVALNTGEVLTAVILPGAALSGRSAFLKLGARRHLVISIVMVAARVQVVAGRVAGVAVAVGAASGTAQRLPAVEAALTGIPVAGIADAVREADVAVALSPIDDVRATASYRVKAATELVRRALVQAGADQA